jgi:hypothetical protein
MTLTLPWDLSVLKEAFHEACESKQLEEVRWLAQFIKTKLLEQLADEEHLEKVHWLTLYGNRIEKHSWYSSTNKYCNGICV